MNGGDNGMPGTGAFRYGQSFFGGTHFPDTDNIRMLSEDTFQKQVLVDVQRRIFVRSCQKVDDTVDGTSVFIPLNQVKFPASLLNGNESAVSAMVFPSALPEAPVPERPPL